LLLGVESIASGGEKRHFSARTAVKKYRSTAVQVKKNKKCDNVSLSARRTVTFSTFQPYYLQTEKDSTITIK